MMDKESRELLAKLNIPQLEQLAKDKGIDCGESPDRIDYLSILGKSDLISKEDVERFLAEMDTGEKKEKKEEEYLAEVETILKDFKNHGSIFDKGNELLQKMQSNFSEGNLEGTISDGIAGSGMMEEMTNKFEKVRKAFIIYAFRQLIGDVRDSGIDISEAEALVLKGADYFHKGQDKDLEDILKEIANKAKGLQEEQAKRMKELISNVEEFLAQTRDLDVDITEAKELLAKAKDAFDSNKLKKVSYFAIKAKKAAEDARKDKIQGISDSLLLLRTILDDTKGIGADVTEVEKLYSHARTAFDRGKYEECKTKIKEAEQMALQLQDSQIQKAIELGRKRETEKVTDAKPGMPPMKKEFPQDYTRQSTQTYPQTPMPTSQIPAQPRVRKTKCPNCGQSFSVKDGKRPIKIECPYCGMRGMMP
jgi:hypothetical protein